MDGWVYFCRVEGTESRVWKMPADGGERSGVTSTCGPDAIESPTVDDLYYLEAWNRPSALWRLPLAGVRRSRCWTA